MRRGRPVVVPNSPPRRRIVSPISSCSSLGNGPAPTRVVYALEMPQTSSIAFGPMPRPDACGARQRVRGGHERIGAVVDVQHRSLRALEDHRLAVVEHLPHQLRGVRDVLLQAVAVGQVLLGHRVQVQRRVLLERAQRQALGLHRGDDLLLEDLLVEQVLHADAQARGLVRVAGADARGAWCRSAGCRASPRRRSPAAGGRA